MLGPVAKSAADLLASEELDLARECAGDDCGWLFIDRTRNHSRRWCDMKSCGNLAKVHSYRSRKKSVS
jgi:predicted RNA-binding Zn ribbon-like protein